MFRRLHVLETAINPLVTWRCHYAFLSAEAPTLHVVPKFMNSGFTYYQQHQKMKWSLFLFVMLAFATWLWLFLVVCASPARRNAVRASVI
jgi:hypothetical protein